ncbi:MAG: ribonuclease domain-containing protein [Gordonia sp. (in: high G+C Gram-positive bacteria)]|uniref:ribonuclease domain-containing protein n=1 Tax=Gordonia sp. (in: high G+C Gram-positive bacteria) TaxID=84139 RepID=UPI003BB7845A
MSTEARPPGRRALVPAASALILIVVLLATWFLSSGSDQEGKSATAAAVPERVAVTLALIDAHQWPDAAHAPGTQGGRQFGNREGLLPPTGASGERLRFQEWDVNPKQRGKGRDAERIITAQDGSAWYTLDHYRSVVQIRGPAR